MVVHDFDIEWFVAAVGPFKTHSPLIVDTNAVLPLTVSLELLETIARRLTKVHQACCLFKAVQSDLSTARGHSSESSGVFTVSELSGISVPKSGWQAILLAGIRSAIFQISTDYRDHYREILIRMFNLPPSPYYLLRIAYRQ